MTGCLDHATNTRPSLPTQVYTIRLYVTCAKGSYTAVVRNLITHHNLLALHLHHLAAAVNASRGRLEFVEHIVLQPSE